MNVNHTPRCTYRCPQIQFTHTFCVTLHICFVFRPGAQFSGEPKFLLLLKCYWKWKINIEWLKTKIKAEEKIKLESILVLNLPELILVSLWQPINLTIHYLQNINVWKCFSNHSKPVTLPLRRHFINAHYQFDQFLLFEKISWLLFT